MKTWIMIVTIGMCFAQLRSDAQINQSGSWELKDARDPASSREHAELGDTFRRAGNGPSAEREYKVAIGLGLKDAETLESLATVQKWNRHFSAARTSYAEAIELAPTDVSARQGLRELNAKRGLSMFFAYGGWETDSTTKGWQTELSYGGIDRLDPYVGSSYADKFFYTRRSYYGKAYVFLSPSTYLEFGFQQKRYNYPIAITPVPDSNAYSKVPVVDVELGGNLRPRLRGALSYEFYRPNFFFGTRNYAENHKVGGDLQLITPWKPLRFLLQGAVLRDPNPNTTLMDKVNHKVVPVYSIQTLIGGGAALSLHEVEAKVLVLPNRDLDRSTNYSVLGEITLPVASRLKFEGGFIFDHYSSQSVFTGKTAQIYNFGIGWKASPWITLTAGGKVIRRPVQNEQAAYVATMFRWSLR